MYAYLGTPSSGVPTVIESESSSLSEVTDTVSFLSVPGPGDTSTQEDKWVVDVPKGVFLVREDGLPPEVNTVHLLLVLEWVETEVPGRGRHP